MFTPEQITELKKPLDPKHVKEPPPGKYGQYVEGWHVIAEANRIFNFDGWSSETELIQLGEPIETSGKWRVNYRAKVRIWVNDPTRQAAIWREGCGFGQGIDRDIGQAHESALKEAETDARKRALMTFGNPFGLALYDKTKANVQTPPAPRISEAQKVQLMAFMDGLNFPVATLLEVSKIKDLRELPADKFDGAKGWITEQSKQKEAA